MSVKATVALFEHGKVFPRWDCDYDCTVGQRCSLSIADYSLGHGNPTNRVRRQLESPRRCGHEPRIGDDDREQARGRWLNGQRLSSLRLIAIYNTRNRWHSRRSRRVWSQFPSRSRQSLARGYNVQILLDHSMIDTRGMIMAAALARTGDQHAL